MTDDVRSTECSIPRDLAIVITQNWDNLGKSRALLEWYWTHARLARLEGWG